VQRRSVAFQLAGVLVAHLAKALNALADVEQA
jgi:hypothetical protein